MINNATFINQQHPYRATIPPVLDGIQRPLWSVMIPTYNCANYLRETLASVLSQDLKPELMQIEVVDDHSTQDDPASVVEELGRGRVSFYRQPENVGYIKNFNTCLQRSRGYLIHLLHGDDCVRTGFYRKMQQAFDKNPQLGAAFCLHNWINEKGDWLGSPSLVQAKSGILSNWIERIAVSNLIQPPSIVVRRDVYESFGGFDSRISCCGEDWEMWVRIAAHYPMWYEVEPLALYRIHSASLTGRCARTGQNMRDLRLIINIIQSYLPSAIANEVYSKAKDNWAIYSVRDIVPEMLAINDLAAATTQIREALKCSCSFKVIRKTTPLIFKIANRWLNQFLMKFYKR